MLGHVVQPVPPHVRQLDSGRQRGDPSGQQPEAVGRAELGRGLEQELEADTDAEQPAAVVERVAQRLLEPAAQALARRTEGADAGQDAGAATPPPPRDRR